MEPQTLTQKWTHSGIGKLVHGVCTASMVVAAIAGATTLIAVPGVFFTNIWGHLQMLPQAMSNLPVLFGMAAKSAAIAAAVPPVPLPVPGAEILVLPPVDPMAGMDHSMHH